MSLPPGGVPGSGRLRAAVALTPQERRDVMHGFFGRHPGSGRDPRLGFGRALADFQGWLLDSGRIAARGGSRWWAAVNGLMVLDILDAPGPGRARAGEGLDAESRTGAALSIQPPDWRGYVLACVAGDPDAQQQALWDAHGASLDAALPVCAPLLAGESDAEREFAALALGMVERAAALGIRSDGERLGLATTYVYPGGYPITAGGLEDLRHVIAALEASASEGRPA